MPYDLSQMDEERMQLWSSLKELDPEKVIAALPSPRVHTFLGNGGCDIDTPEVARQIRDCGVRLGDPETFFGYRLAHELVIIDQWGKLVCIEVKYSPEMDKT